MEIYLRNKYERIGFGFLYTEIQFAVHFQVQRCLAVSALGFDGYSEFFLA